MPDLSRPFIVAPRASAGFPSPAADYIEESLNLKDLLVRNPTATHYVQVDGDSTRRTRDEGTALILGPANTYRVERSWTRPPGASGAGAWPLRQGASPNGRDTAFMAR